MKLRNLDFEDDDQYYSLLQPRKQNKIKKMKSSTKPEKRERASKTTEM
jgi:hypothetical protein